MRCLLFCSLLIAAQGTTSHGQVSQPIYPGVHHLRSGNAPEWDEFAGKTPEGRRADIQFAAAPLDGDATLFIWQDNVKQPWGVELNGTKLGQLFLMEAPLVHSLSIPKNLLRDGGNTLSIIPPRENDDIFIGEIRLDRRPLNQAVDQATLEIDVHDSDSRQPLPCRITILDERGALAAIRPRDGQQLAVRPGVVYTGNGQARLGVLSGKYVIHATRGFEYGLGTEKISIEAGQTHQTKLAIRREVPTAGYVSSDTHVHTFTFSKHGAATVEERALTLAGEGIELPIATDHEYLANFSQPARKMGVQSYFTPVVGCETTTTRGHFNSFPIELGSMVPDAKLTDWLAIMGSIRATPGVRFVILNHPRNVHTGFQPFAPTNFNAITGENKRGFEFSFDGIEVANSSALQSDWMVNFRDWFALLNYGYRVTAVGSSDGHDVSRYIIGQGRSYVACRDNDLGQIQINEACESFLKGRVLVSLGLLAQMTVDTQFGVGDLATVSRDEMDVAVSVLGPSWATADRLELFANGVRIREQSIQDRHTKSGVKGKFNWRIPRPKHDVHLIAMATGPGVREPYWAIARPYQPSSSSWSPRVVGATNPIWIDADGDGKFTAARMYAQSLIARHRGDLSKLFAELRTYDEAVAAQVAGLLDKAGTDLRGSEVASELKAGEEAVRRGFSAYLQTTSATN